MTWERRCKEGAQWLDHVDAPLGFAREVYSISLENADGRRLERMTSEPSCQFDRQSLDQMGARPWSLEVRQIGDLTASAPLHHVIN